MTLKRNDAKRDENEKLIVEALERAGAFVNRVSSKGFPDLLVIYQRAIYLLEVKTDKGRLTDAQIDWHAVALNHGVRVHVVHNPLEALVAIGAMDE